MCSDECMIGFIKGGFRDERGGVLSAYVLEGWGVFPPEFAPRLDVCSKGLGRGGGRVCAPSLHPWG